MWPALWTSTSILLLSAMIFLTATLIDGSDCTSSSIARRSTPSRFEVSAISAAFLALRPAMSRIEA
jgi:hypothetical protein